MLPPVTDYGVRDLARALVDARRFQGAHSDLAKFYDARCRALAEALGGSASLDSERWPEEQALAGLMETTIHQIVALHSPFADLLEAPENIADLYQHFAAPINEGIRIATEALEDLLVHVIVDLWGIAEDAVVGDDDLRTNGFRPGTTWPDELDYQ